MNKVAPIFASTPPPRQSTPLEKIELRTIPSVHPTRMIGDVYMNLQGQCGSQHVPDLDSFLAGTSRELQEYFAVMVPVEATPFIDFIVLRRGNRMPGRELAPAQPGERVTEHLLPAHAPERLMELASCMAIGRSRFSVAYAALPSALNLKIFRAVMPIWIASMQTRGVILAFAPTFLSLGPKLDVVAPAEAV